MSIVPQSIMYRRQRQGSSPLLTLVLLGIIAGLLFLLNERGSETLTPVPSPSGRGEETLTPVPSPSGRGEIGGASATAPPKANIFIPTAGITTSVIEVYLDGESWDVTQLGTNAGHLQGTAWLGDTGNIVLAGHVELPDGRPGIFASIGQLKTGDPVILSLGSAERRYRVSEVKVVAPDDLSVLYPSATDRLTLITCGAYDFVLDDYQERIVVVAERVA